MTEAYNCPDCGWSVKKVNSDEYECDNCGAVVRDVSSLREPFSHEPYDEDEA